MRHLQFGELDFDRLLQALAGSLAAALQFGAKLEHAVLERIRVRIEVVEFLELGLEGLDLGAGFLEMFEQTGRIATVLALEAVQEIEAFSQLRRVFVESRTRLGEILKVPAEFTDAVGVLEGALGERRQLGIAITQALEFLADLLQAIGDALALFLDGVDGATGGLGRLAGDGEALVPNLEVFLLDLWFWDNEPVLDEAGQPVMDAYGRPVVDKGKNLRLAVVWLVLGAMFFTVRMGFINVRGFRHALEVVRGKYSNPDDAGEVSHFQALTAALSATVGLGNIAGVAIAVSVGGPGATFWMILAGLLGMSSKFTECSLGQMYREMRPDGRVMGGAMHYLKEGLSQKRGMGALGDGAERCCSRCSASWRLVRRRQQPSRSTSRWACCRREASRSSRSYSWVYGAIMAVAGGGGHHRRHPPHRHATAEKIVPLMCSIYVLGGLCGCC